MLHFMVTEPCLVQACLIGFLSCGIFVSWWTTLTFLLEAAPFNLSAFDTGLFGLCGIVSICIAPQLGKITDRFVSLDIVRLVCADTHNICRLHPWTATFVALWMQLGTAAIAFACVGLSLGPIIVVSIMTDVAQQFQQIGNQTRIYKLHPLARARLNGCYGTFVFLGQVSPSTVSLQWCSS